MCQFLVPFIDFMTLWIGFRAHFAREKYCRACARMSFRPRVPSPRCESWRFTGERIWRHCLNYLEEERNAVPCTQCLRNMTNCKGFVKGQDIWFILKVCRTSVEDKIVCFWDILWLTILFLFLWSKNLQVSTKCLRNNLNIFKCTCVSKEDLYNFLYIQHYPLTMFLVPSCLQSFVIYINICLYLVL